VEKYLALAEDERYQPALASALHHQSIRVLRAGDVESAFTAATKANRLIEPLAAGKPAAFRSLHADILDNLAVVTELSGDPTAAERLGHEVLADRRTLAAARPDAYRPQLAATLHNAGRILARHGDGARALAMLAESVALYDELAARRPQRFAVQRDIARDHLAQIESDDD
jgi:hypothetical protein